MKNVIFPILILFFISGCKYKEKPEFIRISTIDVLHADFKTVEIEAEAVFLNQNHVGGTLSTENIDVFIDNLLVAKVSSKEFKVPAKKEFTIPLHVNFETEKLLDTKSNDLLGSILTKFINKKVTVRLEGDLAYKIAGYSSTYPIKHTEEILIK